MFTIKKNIFAPFLTIKICLEPQNIFKLHKKSKLADHNFLIGLNDHLSFFFIVGYLCQPGTGKLNSQIRISLVPLISEEQYQRVQSKLPLDTTDPSLSAALEHKQVSQCVASARSDRGLTTTWLCSIKMSAILKPGQSGQLLGSPPYLSTLKSCLTKGDFEF